MERKFKFGDNVYIKAYAKFGPAFAQIFKYDESKQMYVIIQYDALCPTSSWWWSYAKEEDIELLEKLEGKDNPYDRKKPIFPSDTQLYPANFNDLYTDQYYLAKMATDGEMTIEEYRKKSLELTEQYLKKVNKQ